MQVKKQTCLVNTGCLANLPQGEGPIIKGQGLPINMTFERSLDEGRSLQSLADVLHAEGLGTDRVEVWRGLSRVRKGGTRSQTWSWQGQNRTSAGWERRRNLQDQEGAQGAAQLPPEKGWYSKYLAAGKQAAEQSERVHPGLPLPCQALTLQLRDHREVQEVLERV